MSPKQKIPGSLDFESLKTFIPQRFPFLMLDKISKIIPGELVIGIKNLTGNEWFYQGHFPTKAITPGAMILESIAQAGIIFFQFSIREEPRNFTYLLGKVKIQFFEPVFPGSQLVIEITPVKLISRAGILKGKASVEGRTVAEGEFALAAKPNNSW